MKTIVVALGGNAILQPKEKGTIEEQMANVAYSAQQIVKLVKEGNRVVIVHGNGPQVGNILLQNAAAREYVPAMPLDVCGAQSQGLIGYMMQQCILNELAKAGLQRQVVTLLTQVVVNQGDPAFQHPSKPIGAFFSQQEAERNMAEKGETWVEDSGRGWRKVVASPYPERIVELDTIRTLVENDMIVIAAGGGGIPVIDQRGQLIGVEAVIDKDLVSSLLAKELGADTLMIATDVTNVALNWGKPNQQNLERLTVDEAKTYLAEGQFAKGSMGPKIEAALNFVEAGGEAFIAFLGKLEEGIKGESGTKILWLTD